MEPFSDDQEACCRFLFDPLSILYDLIENPEATRTTETCYRSNCSGTVWEVGSIGTELTCDRCATVLNTESGSNITDRSDNWEGFWSHRSRYHHSGNIRCVGGFPIYEYNSNAEQLTDIYV